MIKTFLELVTIHCVYVFKLVFIYCVYLFKLVFYNDVIVVLSLQENIMLMFIHVEIP